MRDESGTVIILIALALTVLLAVLALVVDLGYAYMRNQRLQHIADAMALAAAQDLPDTTVSITVAYQYANQNGENPATFTITFSDNNQIVNVRANKQISLIFAKVLGFDHLNLKPSASASRLSIGKAFDYVLFSGSTKDTLTLNGSGMTVQGSSHTNQNFVANGSKMTITGSCEAVAGITVNGSQMNIPNRAPNSPYVDMPDFSDTIKSQAQQAGNLYNGDKIYNGSQIQVNNPIYVNGNVTVNGSHFVGQGCILATGNITFNGSNLNQSSEDAVCFYSKNGSITINGAKAEIDGILYAPNGSITFNGSNQTVNGRVIGYTVILNGSGSGIFGGTGELASLPSGGVRLVK